MKVHLGKFTLNLQASWVDEDRSLLEHLRLFLSSKDIIARLSETWTEGRKYFDLSVAESGNVLELFACTLPHLDKKRSQIRAAVDYLRNKITADEFAEAMNEAVRARKRSSSPLTFSIPYTKELGLRLAKSSQRWRKRALSKRQVELMRHDREAEGMSYGVLGIRYGVSPATAHFALNRYRD